MPAITTPTAPTRTMTTATFRRRLAVPAAVAALATTLAALTAAPAHAATTGAFHPDRDHAGSQIRLHESGSRMAPADTGTAASSSAPAGLDVSSYQGSVDWSSVSSRGGDFAYVKATEGTGYTNPSFTQQYDGSYQAGLIRGAYHFALPDRSSGATQAAYFVAHGGGWSPDGKTLPPALDIEYNPYGSTCYGLSDGQMVSWIKDFSDTVRARTGVYPTIYTSTSWWKQCTGNSAAFGATNPLWIARYASSPGTLPAGWSSQTFWQYDDSGTFPGDQDRFHGSLAELRALATAGNVD